MSARALLARWPTFGAWLLLGLAGFLPVIARLVTPATLLGQTTASACVALGALAGFGAFTAHALRRQHPGLVDALGLGIGVFLVVGGGFSAFHVFSTPTQLAVLTAGIVLNAIAIVLYRDTIVETIAEYLRSASAPSVVVVGLVVGITLLHVIGAGSNHYGAAFDDDGNWLAAAKRLRDTGAFGDFIGYPRANQLGGTVVMTGLVATSDEVRSSWLAEGIGFAVSIIGLAAIAFPRRGEPATRSRLWQGAFVFLILFLALSAKAQAEKELSAFWIPTALVIASYRILSSPIPWTRARSFELGLVLGGLCTLRLELVPFALAFIVMTMRDEEGQLELGRVAASGGALLVAVLPLAIDRFVEGRPFTLAPGKLVPLVALLGLAAFADARGRRRPFPRMAWACAVGIALTYVGPTVVGGYSRAFSWPLMFGVAFIATAELARSQWALRLGPSTTYRFGQFAAVALVVIGMLSIMRAQDSSIRWNWRDRTQRWLTGAKLSNAMPQIAGVEPYARVTSELPPNEAVLAWVDRPELLNFTERAFFDLRVPRLFRSLRKFSWEPPDAPLANVRRATGARYLLLQTDHLRDKRAKDSAFYEIWCSPKRTDSRTSPYAGRPIACADPLERERLHHRVVTSVDNVYLIDLDQPSPALSAR